MSIPRNGGRGHPSLVTIVGGTMLALVGMALLADQLGYVLPYRWVFLVLLVPAAAAIADAIRVMRLSSWMSVGPLSRLIAGVLFAAIGMLLFLGLNTGLILPAIIIVLGVSVVLRALAQSL